MFTPLITNRNCNLQRSLGIGNDAGSALIITLAVLVLLTGAILTFFIQAMSDRQVEASRGGKAEAEGIARSGGNYIINQFLQEISNPSYSNSFNSSGTTIYQPITNANAVPRRLISTGLSLTDPNFKNLVRQSVPTADSLASTDNTAAAANNGRLVTVSRWNAPALVVGAGFSTSDQLPNWIYVDPNVGPVSTASKSIVGRFAYNVYETDGLLDVNVAGIASSAIASISALKGTVAGTDLTQLGVSQTDTIDPFLAFRNPSATSSSIYSDNIMASAGQGFLSSRVTSLASGAVYTGNFFMNRQDLIRFAQDRAPSLTSVLPYLTTFSREKNTPCWGPASDLSGAYKYQTNENADVANRFVPNVRIAGTSGSTIVLTHYSDGGDKQSYEIPANSSLIQRRFSLAKLAWITSNGAKAGIAAVPIQACFGLQWDGTNYRWNYVGATGSTLQTDIETLQSVSSEQREPNFFELLKAAILSGSMGQIPGPEPTGPTQYPGYGSNYGGFQGGIGRLATDVNSVSDRQIIQIGVNIIDQNRADNYPTAIFFKSTTPDGSVLDITWNTLYGIKDLPYLSQIDSVVWQFASNNVTGWLQPELWNPHAARSTSIAGPSNFRIRAYGEASTAWTQWAPFPTGIADPSRSSDPVSYLGDAANAICFTATSTDFRNNPSPIPIANLVSPTPTADYTSTTWFSTTEIVGFNAGTVSLDGTITSGMSPNSGMSMWTAINFSLPTTLVLEYQATDGSWRTYNYLSRLDRSYQYRRINYQSKTGSNVNYVTDAGGNFDFNTVRVGSPTGDVTAARVDPRTDRFSTSLGRLCVPTGVEDFQQNSTFRPTTLTVNPIFDSWPGTGTTNFTYTPTSYPGNGTVYYLYGFARNITSATAYYTDPDNQIRPADGWKQSDAGILVNGNVNSPERSIVLDEPFQSVADLGYAFRDLPFRSLDFSSTNSADAALLDFFSLYDEPVVIAGGFNPNTAPAKVWEAVLTQGSTDNVIPSSPPISSSDASALTTSLMAELSVNSTVDGPAKSRADLVSRFSKAVDNSLSSSYQKNKSYREAPIRAVVSSANTRTWNLLIDVIAQSGVMSPGMTGVGNFIIKGEKRYWFHVAIDRYTGEIIDQNWESVYE